MVIRVTRRVGTGSEVFLDDARTGGIVELDASGLDSVFAANALFAAGAAAAVDGNHVLVSVEWLETQAGDLLEDPQWIAAFDDMLTSARKQGNYHSQVGAIRIPMLNR